jgi:hypothetical protein
MGCSGGVTGRVPKLYTRTNGRPASLNLQQLTVNTVQAGGLVDELNDRKWLPILRLHVFDGTDGICA